MIGQKDLQFYCGGKRVLLRAEDFIYILPYPDLRGYISNYTITFPGRDTISDCYTVIPHGSATLVFSHNGKSMCSSLFGPITSPCMVGSRANQSGMLLIIEFQPAGLHTFTGVTQKELTDCRIPFEWVSGTLDRSIQDLLYGSKSVAELVTALDCLLLSCLHAVYPSELKNAVGLIIDTMGNISHGELSASVHYSERHLNRIFNEYLGMTAKTFSRMVRINKAIRLLQNPRSSITFVSDLTRFYDLPHFIHDFKSVCGITPQEYRRKMSDFYSEIAKF